MEPGITGVIITPLKKIAHPLGDVYHGIKKSDIGYKKFGEAYFSTIKNGKIKPWKKHLKMTLNLIVPIGEIKFVLLDEKVEGDLGGKFFEIILSQKNYLRLTIPPNIWVAFQGMGKGTNLLLNIADREHDPDEVERKELIDITYNWNYKS